MHLARFTFNAFGENTYVLYDDTKECVIIDPGCSDTAEQKTLVSFIAGNNLIPTVLFNTHCHIDHVLGNKFVSEKYGLALSSHKGEQQVLDMQPMVSNMYGIAYDPSPSISIFYDGGDELTFGNTTLKVLFTPGHSPASISLYHPPTAILVAGDVLFQQSIGRTDLPGGNMDTLLASIRERFFVLPDNTTVYPGHGPETTIGEEKRSNPFLK